MYPKGEERNTGLESIGMAKLGGDKGIDGAFNKDGGRGKRKRIIQWWRLSSRTDCFKLIVARKD